MATAKEGDRIPGRERLFIETETVGNDNNERADKFGGGGTSYGSCPDEGEAQGSSESSALGFAGYVEGDDDERRSAGGRGEIWSRASGEWRGGRRREREQQGKEEGEISNEERIRGVPRPRRDGGMRRMVDGRAPLVSTRAVALTISMLSLGGDRGKTLTRGQSSSILPRPVPNFFYS